MQAIWPINVLTSFCGKIQISRGNILINMPMMFDIPKTATELCEFRCITKEELAPLLCSSVGKSFALYPIPGCTLRDYMEELQPIFTRIVNLSLQTAIMPYDLKEAAL
jgi:hypothetical protein